MARLSLVPRLLRQQPPASGDGAAAPPAGTVTPAPRRRPAPPAGELRRERRALLRLREERLRDLGGLALEMYRRDRFREDLVLERCAELIALEARIHELEALLGSASALRRTTPAARCECGAPLLWRARFCANCGRPAPQANA
ncbi:MAG TPA: hypothetical protein VNT58_03770 [Gaiellaceae bacterium]|nr:hypothetical protein [Gaiellaceae bacterium]